MSTSFCLRLFAFAFVTSTVVAACGTDRYIVAVVDSGGSAGSGTASTGASSATNARNTNGGSGGISAGMGGTSAAGANVGSGGVSGTSNPSGGAGSASAASGSGGAGLSASGGNGEATTSMGGGQSTSENVAGGGTGGVRSVDTRTSLGGSESTTTTGFAGESCLCQMVTTPECAFDGVSGEQSCSFDCVMWPGACDQGCPCTESMQLSYSQDNAEAEIVCRNPDGCDPAKGCAVEFSKFPPYQVKRSSCLVLISLP
ncbi:MAG TPA: hypothetical protein VKP30_25340 [Polyangiaceae bacterium]|nr:hypothetical protein [Polyangiaceae bacterium]